MYNFSVFGDSVAFLSFFTTSVLVLMISKKFLEKVSYRWYILSFGIFLIGIDNILRLLSVAGYIGTEFLPIVTVIIKIGGSILLLAGFTLVLFELLFISKLRMLEGRKKDIEILLSSVESKANNGLSKEVINNLRKELIDVEKRMEELK